MKFVWILLAFASMAHSASKISVSTGEARTKEGSLLYSERGSLHWKGNLPEKSESNYFGANGEKLATFTSDFSQSLYLPDFRLDDFRSQKWYSLKRLTPTSVEVRRGKTGEVGESEILDLGEGNSAGGAGLIFLARDNLSKLLAGESVKLRVVAPAYLDCYTFLLNSNGATATELEARLVIRFFLARLFAPDVNLTFDLKTKELLTYYGPSIIPDEKGKFHTVKISYDH